jgi:cytochrome c oxidase subunit 2
MRRLVSGGAAGLYAAAVSATAFAQNIGQPTDGALGLQPGVTPLRHEATAFHDLLLMPIITVISLFVLALLIWVMVKYNRRANPIPARFTHNTMVEVVWTVAPVLILMVIAIFSFRLLFNYHTTPPVDVTVKVTGRQWNWDYEYPDLHIPAYTSAMLPEAEARARGVPYRLAATAPMVVPVNRVVRILTTAEDVIHAFAMPAFGNKVDAVPGRVNETWFRAERVGTYYGQCSELCGVDHAFMPIEIRVVSQAEFDAWVRQRARPPAPAAAPAATNAATPAAGATNAAPAAADAATNAAATNAAAAPAAGATNAAAPSATNAAAPAPAANAAAAAN